MGNQPFGWGPPPYLYLIPVQEFYFLDQDNPAVVTPGSCQLFHDNGIVHGEWETLLHMDPTGIPSVRYYHGLITGLAKGFPLPVQLCAEVQNFVNPVQLDFFVDMAVPPYGPPYDWANTRTWTWQNVGYWFIQLIPMPPSFDANSVWMPSSANRPRQDMGGYGVAFPDFLRLRVVAANPLGINYSQHSLYTAVSGARNPVAEDWRIVAETG